MKRSPCLPKMWGVACQKCGMILPMATYLCSRKDIGCPSRLPQGEPGAKGQQADERQGSLDTKKEMDRKTTISQCMRILIGLLFAVSGITKVIDTRSFAAIAAQYAEGGLITAMAVLLPAVELLLGLSLILDFHTRPAVAAVAILTLFFTAVFAYGYFFKGVEDCGCFGPVQWLKLPPWAVFLRNAVIIVLGLWLYSRYGVKTAGTGEAEDFYRYKITALLVIGALAFTVAGVSYRSPYFQKQDIILSYLGRPVADGPFAALGLSADSTYALFVFSPGCPHCWDATANVASWKSAGLVQGIVAVTPASQRQRAEERYLPHFGAMLDRIYYLRDSEMARTASSYPHVVVVQRDTVVHIRSGSIPSGYKMKYFNAPDKGRRKTSVPSPHNSDDPSTKLLYRIVYPRKFAPFPHGSR